MNKRRGKTNFNHRQSGFTLIELLVVISIISLLSSIILVATVNARRKARDTTRKENLKQIATALELFYQENSGYPIFGAGSSATADWIPGLIPKYLAKLPQDPIGGQPTFTGCAAEYSYYSDGKDYKLLSHCTIEGGFTVNDPMNDPTRDGGPNYASKGETGPPDGQASNPSDCDGAGDNTGVWAWGMWSSPRSRCW